MSCRNLTYILCHGTSLNDFARKGSQFSGRDGKFLGNNILYRVCNAGYTPLCYCSSAVYRLTLGRGAIIVNINCALDRPNGETVKNNINGIGVLVSSMQILKPFQILGVWQCCGTHFLHRITS